MRELQLSHSTSPPLTQTVSLLFVKGVAMQTKKQKQEKALEYWRKELQNNRLPHREFYIRGQIAILERKLTLRATDGLWASLKVERTLVDIGDGCMVDPLILAAILPA
jgi:hypothetical protein